jgi:hypothetical protein
LTSIGWAGKVSHKVEVVEKSDSKRLVLNAVASHPGVYNLNQLEITVLLKDNKSEKTTNTTPIIVLV